ncbi:MAG: FAD-dependent thymidylate synthase [Candidatus Aenigmarchaeota archaeon]|nr:FAD-dependent thymidylate synthase [Candidatus Aenigmarchaeota archaeon]
MIDEFTEDEKNVLRPFFSNMDKDIFVIKNLPEVVKGALFSRYSRTTKSVRRVLLEEFIKKPEMGFSQIVGSVEASNQANAIKKAEEFYDRVLVDYGDDSVAELGGAHIACENVSIIATKIMEDARIGLSPLEKSTRYVFFDQKENGGYKFYKEPVLATSQFADEYEQIMSLLFDTYARMVEPVKKFMVERFPKTDDVSDRAYQSTIRAKACDTIRGLLPAGTLTNMGIYGNGRAFEYLLIKMRANPLTEMRNAADSMKNELGTVIPSFVKRVSDKHGDAYRNYISKSLEDTKRFASGFSQSADGQKAVQLVDYDNEAEIKIISAILYPHTHLPESRIRELVASLGADERQRILKAYVSERANRRHRPGRAFENAYYKFDIVGNYGMFRDLHRHRMLTQERQSLTTNHGYDMAKELAAAGLESGFKDAMEAAKNAFGRIAAKFPAEAQYVVPLAYRVRWYFLMNLREVYHLCELRSVRQGHPDYRLVAQKMFEEVKKVHPNLAAFANFLDTNTYDLERLEAEKRIDRKIEDIGKKYPGNWTKNK